VTGSDGGFIMRDVNTSYIPDLRWYPPEQWLRGGMAIAGESGGNVDVGTIQLRPDTVLRVTVEFVGGSPLGPRDPQPTVILQSKTQFGPRLVAEDGGGYRVLRQISFDEGTWEISLFTNGRSEHYEAPFHAERGSRDQLLRLRLLRDTLKADDRYDKKGTIEVREETLPPATIEREFHARGHVLAPDRSPIPGAIVEINAGFFGQSMPRWTVSAADGTFDLRYNALACLELGVSYGGTFAQIENSNSKEDCETRWSRPQDLVISRTSRIVFQTEGVDPASVRAYWWHDSIGWSKFPQHPWISRVGYPPPVCKMDAAGLLPLAQNSELPFLAPDKQPPAEVPLRFRFDSSGQRILTVRSGGRPLPDAIVDVEKVDDLAKNSRIQLGTYTTSASGELRLGGGTGQLVEVFVYADGHEPRRAIWTPGVPLTLDLTPRNAIVSFGPGAALARIRPVENSSAVITANLTTTTQTRLAPGEYDITTYSDRGAVVGYQRITLNAAEAKTIDPAVDKRPRLTVRFPAAGWQSAVTESTPRGGAVNWAAMIVAVGTLQLNDVPATRTQSSPQEDVYLLSWAGRMQVHVQRKDSPLMWREINVLPAESLSIEIPAEQATLEAPSNFDPGKGNEHGVAGPRLQLIAADLSGWSITEFIPRQNKEGVFTIGGIPPGDYRLYHHLFNGNVTYRTNGKDTTYNRPASAWGGVAVHLTAGKTTRIAPLNGKLGELSVHLSDPAGRPIENATLRIRDRMSDSWRQFAENPAQVEEPGHPIPYPTAVRIVDGKATLPQMRSGWLEFAVETDAGPAYSYTLPVQLGQELQVSVPLGEQR
jgi:hypothetical protein